MTAKSVEQIGRRLRPFEAPPIRKLYCPIVFILPIIVSHCSPNVELINLYSHYLDIVFVLSFSIISHYYPSYLSNLEIEPPHPRH